MNAASEVGFLREDGRQLAAAAQDGVGLAVDVPVVQADDART